MYGFWNFKVPGFWGLVLGPWGFCLFLVHFLGFLDSGLVLEFFGFQVFCVSGLGFSIWGLEL